MLRRGGRTAFKGARVFAFIAQIAEERIRRNMDEGGFENLEGAGKPLVFEDDSFVPEDLRLAYKVLRNGGFVPQEVAERKEIHTALDLLAHARDERERYRCMRRVDFLLLRLGERRGRGVAFEELEAYYAEVVSRLGGGDGNGG